MITCAKCGKELGSFERIPVWGSLADKHPHYKGKIICEKCLIELRTISSNPSQSNSATIPTAIVPRLREEVNRAILWQKNEEFLHYVGCKEFFEDRNVAFGARIGHNGYLVVTNQRALFACKLGLLARDYAIMYSANLEDITSVSHGRFGLNDKLIILDKSGQHRDFVNPRIQDFLASINEAISKRKGQIQAEKDKERVQIILDFSSLKDIISKGGLVMATYKCPNCNGMVNIPEAGKVLMCQYCGNPIKPIDIFEKIRSLIS